jgi:hypothetical protein
MGNSFKNISIILGLITVGFGIYYLVTQYSTSQTGSEFNEQTMQNMLNNTSVFIKHGNDLNKIGLDLDVLDDPRFLSLRSFSTPKEETAIGRDNPFSELDERDSN